MDQNLEWTTAVGEAFLTRGYSMILRCDGVFSSRVIVAFKYADSSLLNN